MDNFFYNPLLSKALIILFIGLLEQFIYSGHLLFLTNKKPIASSIILFIHLNIYLLLIANIIHDLNNILWFVPIYALGCASGNYIRVKLRLYKDILEKKIKNEKTKKKLSKISK